MIDYTKLIEKLDFECRVNGLQPINNEVENTAENREKILQWQLEKATNFVYLKRKGADIDYNFTAFESEVSEYESIIVNMAYTAITRIGSEGQTMSGENGVTRQYESSGMYLLSDIKQIKVRAGV